jgi:glycine/D-amino acid oxidase-like deaminating enzyme
LGKIKDMLASSNKAQSCLIIGAGLAGLTAALELARRGADVTLVSPLDDPVCASNAAHGISTIKGILESDSKLFGLKLEGHRGFDAWLTKLEEEIGKKRPLDVWRKGVEENFPTTFLFKKEFGRIYRKDFIGAKQVQWLRKEDDCFASVKYPGDWWINPRYLLDTLHEGLTRLRVKKISANVQSVILGADGVSARMLDGDVSSQAAIICAGAGVPSLLERSGLETIEKLYGVSGFTFGASTNIDRQKALVKGTSGVTQVGREIFWGSTSDSAFLIDGGDSLPGSAKLDASKCRELGKKTLHEIFPVAACDTLTAFSVKWGVRTRTRHRSPLVERVAKNNAGSIWVNTGYYKSGIILSWLMAEKLAEAIISGHPYSSSH